VTDTNQDIRKDLKTPPERTGTEPIRIRSDLNKASRLVGIVCIVTALFLVLIDAVFSYARLTEIGTIQRFCNITREDSLASWLAAIQTLMVGITAWLIFFVLRHLRAPKRRRAGWFLLAAFFTYLAVDDGALIHERLGTAVKEIFVTSPSAQASTGWLTRFIDVFPSYTWQIVLVPLFAILGLFVLFFLRAEFKRKDLRRLAHAGLLCLVVAVGLDFFEGLSVPHAWNIQTRMADAYDLNLYAIRHFSKSLEEFIEIVGMALFWVAFIKFLSLLIQNGVEFFPKKSLAAVTMKTASKENDNR
jgi:hypothetical protein